MFGELWMQLRLRETDADDGSATFLPTIAATHAFDRTLWKRTNSTTARENHPTNELSSRDRVSVSHKMSSHHDEDLVELLDCGDVDHVNKHWLEWFASRTGIAGLHCTYIGVNSMMFTGEWKGAAVVAKLCHTTLADIEWRAVECLSPHINIVHFVCYMDLGSTKMIVMERLVPLFHVMSESTLSIDDCSFLANDAIVGMVHMHRRGYVHADIKLDNLCVRMCADGSMVCVFVDFGSCLPLGDTCVGRTHEYAPPSCFRSYDDGHIEYMPRTPLVFEDDMWSLAVLIMALLSKRQFTTLDIMRDRSSAMRELDVAFHARFGDDEPFEPWQHMIDLLLDGRRQELWDRVDAAAKEADGEAAKEAEGEAEGEAAKEAEGEAAKEADGEAEGEAEGEAS